MKEKKKTLCNYCFVAECIDLAKTKEQQKEALGNTKCTGLSKKDSEAGGACDYFSKLIMGGDISV